MEENYFGIKNLETIGKWDFVQVVHGMYKQINFELKAYKVNDIKSNLVVIFNNRTMLFELYNDEMRDIIENAKHIYNLEGIEDLLTYLVLIGEESARDPR